MMEAAFPVLHVLSSPGFHPGRYLRRCAGLLSWFVWLFVLLVGANPAARAQEPSGSPEAREIKTHLKQILDQPEFHPEQTDNPMARAARSFRESWDKTVRWFNGRWEAFQRWLRKLFSFGGPRFSPAAGLIGAFVGNAFAVLVIVFGGWLIAWLLRNFWILRQQKQAQARTAFDEAEDAEALITEPNAWIQQAETFSAANDYRRAFRAVFLAILLLLDQGGVIEFDRARTNGDYLRLLRRKNLQTLYDALFPLVLEFDRRWYGLQRTEEADYRRLLREFEQIRTRMASEAGPAGAGLTGQTIEGRA